MIEQSAEAALDPVVAELEAGGVIDDLAAAARRHGVMVSLTLTPYDEETDR